jgi:uncharacterized membrane protein YfcA
VTLPALGPGAWALGAVAAFLVGVAKTGVPGLGILVVPLMVITVGDARHAAGWLLPLLCAADVVAVATYRRHAQVWRLFSLAPWVLAGMGAGAIALGAPEALLRRLVGAIVLAMIALHGWRRLRGESAAAAPVSSGGRLHAATTGVVAGFATTVANAAGPVMSTYLLSKRLPKSEFVATGAWFFLVINLAKLPVYGYHRLIGWPSLAFDAALLPAVIAGALFGRALFVRIPQRAFDGVVVGLTVAGALLLIR